MKKISTLVVALFVVLQLSAQDFAFKVLITQGGNQIQTETGWTDLNAGAIISNTSKIKVGEGGYIGLVSSEGKTLELKSTGEFTAADLKTKLTSSKQSSYATKYSNFVVDQMTENNAGANYEITGSVDRGAGDKINLIAPNEIIAVKEIPLTLNWAGEKANKGFEVRILNLYEQVVYKTTSTSQSIKLDLKDVKLKETENYIIKIVRIDDEEESEPHLFKLLDATASAQVVKDYNEMTKTIDASSALGKMLEAAFFDSNKLTAYSINCYQAATTIEPEVSIYSTNLKNYCAKNGIAF